MGPNNHFISIIVFSESLEVKIIFQIYFLLLIVQP